MASLRLEAITRHAGSDLVLDRVDLDVGDGELVALLGSSGSGKTSILRAIAGLDEITSGRIIIGDVDVTGVPTRERDVGMVHQSNTLFPTHTSRSNVAFPLRVRDMDPEEISNRVAAESRAFEIAELLERRPRQLSEGQRQLVQIARAMVRPPRLFLLDEPLGRLDPPTRVRLRRELRLLQSGYGVAMVYATNDPEEAMAVADRVAVVEGGRIVQVAEPQHLWRNPVNRPVAEVTGPLGLIDVTVVPDGRGYRLTAPDVQLRGWAPALGTIAERRGVVGVRPDAIRIDERGPVAATVDRLTFRGPHTGRDLLVGPARLTSHVGEALPEGSRIHISFERWHVFDPAGETVCTIGP